MRLQLILQPMVNILIKTDISPKVLRKIQDSLYYQDYSYVIKVSQSINRWRDALKRAVHPSGFYVTGEVTIETKLAGGVRQPVGSTISLVACSQALLIVQFT